MRLTYEHRLILLGIGAVVLLALLLSPHSPSPEQQEQPAAQPQPVEPDSTAAWVTCHYLVSARLRAPSTAQFEPYRRQGTLDNGGRSYSVSSYVDAQNGFGAQIRTPYFCNLDFKDGEWKLRNLSVNGN